MLKLRDRPIRQKITLVIMMIASAVLLLAFAALFCFQAYTLKQHSAHELAVVGEIQRTTVLRQSCSKMRMLPPKYLADLEQCPKSLVHGFSSRTSSSSLFLGHHGTKPKSKPRDWNPGSGSTATASF